MRVGRPAGELLAGRVKDFLAGLQAVKRSDTRAGPTATTCWASPAGIACQLHGPDASVQRRSGFR